MKGVSVSVGNTFKLCFPNYAYRRHALMVSGSLTLFKCLQLPYNNFIRSLHFPTN